MPLDKIRVQIGDTGQLGYNFLTGGSRATFSSGMATVEAAREVMKEACKRAAKLWELPEDAVEYEDGARASRRAQCRQARADDAQGDRRHRRQDRRADRRLCAHQRAPARHRLRHAHLRRRGRPGDRQGRGSCATPPIQDAGRAIHPSYVEGQIQGGVAQGIGWALNEEYIYDDDGKLQNAGFLDYRMPVASDLPMIDTVIVEVPNPRHPYGVRGVGETPIVPPMAAIANAMRQRHRRALHRAADVAAQGAEGARRGPRQGHGEDLRSMPRAAVPSPCGEGLGVGGMLRRPADRAGSRPHP